MKCIDETAQTVEWIENFTRAETDLYFGRFVKEKGLGKLGGSGEVTPIVRRYFDLYRSRC